MDMELISLSVCVIVLLVPMLWLGMDRSKQIQPKYRKGITMMGVILLLVYLVHEYYPITYQLGFITREVFTATMITGVVMALVFAAIFMKKKSIAKIMPDSKTVVEPSSDMPSSMVVKPSSDMPSSMVVKPLSDMPSSMVVKPLSPIVVDPTTYSFPSSPYTNDDKSAPWTSSKSFDVRKVKTTNQSI